MVRVLLVLCVAVFISKISPSTGACTFPSNLIGQWDDNVKGTLTFTSTTFQSWTVSDQGSFVFTCFMNVGNIYISKSVLFSFLSVDWYAYLCMDMTQINAYLYHYNLGSSPEVQAGNDRVKVLQTTTSIAITEAVVCDSTTYAAGTYSLLVKKDSVSSAISGCPSNLRKYWHYTFDSGSGNVCTADTRLDGCSVSGLTFHLDRCKTLVAYSASGVLQCLHGTTSGGNTYLTLYNTDTVTNESMTFRFTCLMFTSSGDTVYMTQYPRACVAGQTTTSVSSPGAKLVLWKSASCPEDVGLSASILGVIGFFSVVLLILIIIAIGWFAWKHQKQLDQKARGKSKQGSHPSGPDVVDALVGKDGQPLTSRSVVLNVPLPHLREGESDTDEMDKAHTYHVIGVHPGAVNDRVGNYVGGKKFSSKGDQPGRAPVLGESQRALNQRGKAPDGRHLPPIVEDGSGGNKGKLVRRTSSNNKVFPGKAALLADASLVEETAASKRVKPIAVRQLRKTADDKKQPVKKTSKSRIPKETKENEDEDDLYVPPPTPIKVTRVDISALSAGTKGRTRDVTVEVTDVDGTGDKTSVQSDTIKEQPEIAIIERAASKLWLEPKPAVDDDVWSKVSNLWKLGQIWQDKADKF